MQLIDGVPVYSATDLVGFLACEHLTNLERAALRGLVARPMRADPEMDRIADRGMQHERSAGVVDGTVSGPGFVAATVKLHVYGVPRPAPSEASIAPSSRAV